MRMAAKRVVQLTMISALILSMTGCGTLTGIPSHGGGKRFAVEQRLVSASIRSTLMDIDVSPLRGQRVAVIYDLVSDEGGGTLTGGRFNLFGAVTSGMMVSPVTSTNSAFQIFNLTDVGTNYNNTGTGMSQTSAGTSNIVMNGSGTQSSTQNIGAVTQTSSGTSSTIVNTPATSTTITTQPTTSSTTVNQGDVTTTVTPGTTTTQTGAVITTQSSTPDKSVTTTGATSSSTNTGVAITEQQTSASTGTGSGSTSTTVNTGASTNTATGATTETSMQAGTSTGTMTSTTDQKAQGGNTTHRQEISPQAVHSTQQQKGVQQNRSVTLQYQGLGDYTNFNVPKSDASLLMGLVRNYLLLNGVEPTVPTDPRATAVLYVTVDVFGIVRSRFDAYVYNQESVLADTAIEMMAFDRSGKIIMRPRSANNEAKYDERYFLWAGPFATDEEVRQGKGLLVDFSGVDGSKPTYPSKTKRTRMTQNSQ